VVTAVYIQAKESSPLDGGVYTLEASPPLTPCYCIPSRPAGLLPISTNFPTSNTQILGKFQSETLRMIVDAPWYVPNTVMRRDLETPTVKEEIRRYSSQYSARHSAHPNDLIVNLFELPDNRRL
jgi:hypothetical protein